MIEDDPDPAIHAVVRWRPINPALLDHRGIPHQHHDAESEPAVAPAWLSQAFVAAAPKYSGHSGRCRTRSQLLRRAQACRCAMEDHVGARE
ncbi:hypothetical protein [Methylocella silvestris]|nr:hypothetical protein [Methylocella silvestris]